MPKAQITGRCPADQLRAGLTSPAIRTAVGDLFTLYEAMNTVGTPVPTALVAGFEQVRQALRLDQPNLMTVRILDRSHPVTAVRTVTVPAVCIRCGGRRGDPFEVRSTVHGMTFRTEFWDNPCGHLDSAQAVLAEARRYAALVDVEAVAGGVR